MESSFSDAGAQFKYTLCKRLNYAIIANPKGFVRGHSCNNDKYAIVVLLYVITFPDEMQKAKTIAHVH